MPETRAPYVTESKAPAWTVAPDVKRWDDLVEQCQVVVLPEMLRPHFAIGDHGTVHVNDTTEMDNDETAETLFIDLWDSLHAIQQCIQLAMGNALVFAQERFDDDFVQALMEHGTLNYHTYRQRMYVARNVPAENQDPTVSFSKLRAIAPAPPPIQRQLLEEVHEGKLTSSVEVVARRKVVMRQPPAEQFAPTAKLSCPICGKEHAWDVDRLQLYECSHCHGKALELRDHLDESNNAIRHLYATGERGPLDAYVQTYGVLPT